MKTYSIRRRDFGVLLGGGQATESQRWQLVDSLFRQPKSLVVSGIGTLVMVAVCWYRTSNFWYLVWGATTIAILGLRLGLGRAFHRHPKLFSADNWAKLFVAGAIGTASAVGAGLGMTLLLVPDWVTLLYLGTNVISFAGAAAVRNSASPLAARLQTTIALGLPGLACLASGISYLQAFAVLILFHLVAQFEIIWSLGTQTRRLMDTEREQAVLNARLSVSCEQLESANTQLTRLSCTDGLTGLANRRSFDSTLRAEWARAVRERGCVALLMLDVDNFKRFNDTHGHLAGDDALRSVARALESNLRRPSDFAGRFGGEEFAILLPGIDADAAAEMAERIRSSISMLAQSSNPTPISPLSVSLGVAVARPDINNSCVRLIALADEALYCAKSNGRNRVEISRAIAHAEL